MAQPDPRGWLASSAGVTVARTQRELAAIFPGGVPQPGAGPAPSAGSSFTLQTPHLFAGLVGIALVLAYGYKRLL